jgi:hypothetical protein
MERIGDGREEVSSKRLERHSGRPQTVVGRVLLLLRCIRTPCPAQEAVAGA